MDDNRTSDGKYKKGHAPSSAGRPVGARNKLPLSVKEEVKAGFERATPYDSGLTRYVRSLMTSHPPAAVPLIAKMIPTESKTDLNITGAALQVVHVVIPHVPRGTFYSPEVCRKIAANTATIDEMLGGHPCTTLTTEEYTARVSQPAPTVVIDNDDASAPPAPEHNIAPRTPEEALLLAELETLTDEELVRRAGVAR